MPRRLALAVLVPAAALLLVLFGFAGRGADNPVLTGDVGVDNSFAITLTDASGAKVTHVDPGTYTLVVHDHSTFHNFHLLGPGVNVTTDVGAVGDSTFTVTLADGTYTFQCDPHALSGMKATFAVGTPPATTTAAVAKIAARVGPGAKVRVSGAAHLAAGRAVITVTDTSRTENVHLSGPGVNKATGIVFKGTVTWKVALGVGTYTFRSDRHPKTARSFTVAAASSSGSSTSSGSADDGGKGGY